MVPDQTGILDIEAAGGVVGQNVEHRGTPTSLLPLDRQIMQEAEVITPPRRETHGHGGRRAPEPQLPPRGSRVVPQIATDVRTREVSSDRRNDAWSPENVLVDTVARMQQDLADIRAENRLLRMPGGSTCGAYSSAGGFHDDQSTTVWRDDQLGAVPAAF